MTYIELVYAPWFTPSRIPESESRWMRDLPVGLDLEDQLLPSQGSGQMSFRLGTTLSGFDVGTVYYRGYSYSPSFFLQPRLSEPWLLVPTYRREHVWSAFAARELLGFTMRSEAGYFQQDKEDDFLQYVFGVEREWSGIMSPIDGFSILIEYTNELVTQDEPADISTIDFRRVLSNALIMELSYSFDDERRWSVELEGALNLGDEDSYMQPSIVWRKSNFEVKAGLDIISGPPKTFWGGYDENDRVFLNVVTKY